MNDKHRLGDRCLSFKTTMRIVRANDAHRFLGPKTGLKAKSAVIENFSIGAGVSLQLGVAN